MKNLIFGLILVLTACGSSSSVTTSTNSNSSANNTQTPYQIEKNANWTTPAPAPAQGPGPVNLSASNFYFAGDLQIMDNIPLLYICLAGDNLKIDTTQGMYAELQRQYNKVAATPGEVVTAKLRGYLKNDMLIISFINDVSKGTLCKQGINLTGSWKATMPGNHNVTVSMQLNNNFSFTAQLTGDINQTITGEWLMTSDAEVALIYTTITNAFGHNLSFDTKTMTLFVPTNQGTLIFKKQ